MNFYHRANEAEEYPDLSTTGPDRITPGAARARIVAERGVQESEFPAFLQAAGPPDIWQAALI